jgi:hypothetical protein
MPVVYTNKTLAEYMHRLATRQVNDLGWTTGDPNVPTDLGNYQDSVDSLAFEMGVTDIADVPDENIYELRLRSRVILWQTLAEAYVGLYAIGGLARQLARQQLYEHCVQMWDKATLALANFLEGAAISNSGGAAHSEARRIKVVWGQADPFNPTTQITP